MHTKVVPADVHMLLADLACEDENFESALPDYERALDLLSASKAVQTPLLAPPDTVYLSGLASFLSSCKLACSISEPAVSSW